MFSMFRITETPSMDPEEDWFEGVVGDLGEVLGVDVEKETVLLPHRPTPAGSCVGGLEALTRHFSKQKENLHREVKE